MVLEPLGEPFALNQIAFSVLFAVVFIRDVIDHPDNRVRVGSNIVALIGCGLLLVHGVVQPGGAVIMGLIALLFVTSLLVHLAGGALRTRPGERA